MRSAILYALESPSSTLSPILGHSLSSSYWAGGGASKQRLLSLHLYGMLCSDSVPFPVFPTSDMAGSETGLRV